MKFLLLLFCSSVLYATNYMQALTLSSNIENGKKQYELCANCHLESGFGKTNGSFPNLAGQHKSVIIKQLDDINHKKRKNPTMFPFATLETLGSLQNLSDIAGYIAKMPANTHHGQGKGENLTQGKVLYMQHCSVCHGKDGKGNAELMYPKLQHQHYAYLFRQLKWIKSGYRENSNPTMFAIVQNLNENQLSIIADYISRMP